MPAFEVAVASQVPIVPACVLDTKIVWRAKRLLIRPGTVHVVISEPVSTTGLGQHDVAALRARVFDRIASIYSSDQDIHQAGLFETRKGDVA